MFQIEYKEIDLASNPNNRKEMIAKIPADKQTPPILPPQVNPIQSGPEICNPKICNIFQIVTNAR